MEVGPNGSPEKNTTTAAPPATHSTTPDPRLKDELTRIAFYKTYDVMTGVRIAATLGGFFGLMVILVLYKSKSKTERALEDPDFSAAAVAEAEEEERQLAAALEAAAYHQLNPRRSRRSLDTSCVSPGWIRTTTRFSSVGGYSSLADPPTRTHSRLPSFIDEDSPPDETSFLEDIYYSPHLDVPRRASNITCSSSGSSYLERRDSALCAGLPVLPAHGARDRWRPASPPPEEAYDFYYPIDICVIQSTPSGSPCGSDRALYDRVAAPPLCSLKPRLAPLASISSCNSSVLGNDGPDADALSLASDSVFGVRQDEGDTDNDMEEFSTDSDSDASPCCNSAGRTLNPARPPRALLHIDASPSISSIEEETPGKSELPLTDTRRMSNQLEDKPWAQETLF